MNILNVLHICKVYLPVKGGVQIVVKRICDQLSDRFSFTVVSCADDPDLVEPADRVQHVVAKSHGEILSLPMAPTAAKKILSQIKVADVVCIHYPFPIADFSLLFASLRGKKLIVYWHSEIVDQRLGKIIVWPLTWNMLRRADAVVVASPNLIENSGLLQKFRDKCRVIPFGYRPPDSHPSLPVEDRGYYLCVGRHVSYKGIGVLIRAWSHCTPKLKIIGIGPLLDEHRALTEDLKIDDKLEFIEKVDDGGLSQLISGCRALILPSVTPNEAFGLVQIEAMAHGKPVINTNLPSGVPWVARHEREGLTVEPGDSKELADAINRLEQDPRLRESLAQGALERWKTVFDTEVFKRNTAALYADAEF